MPQSKREPDNLTPDANLVEERLRQLQRRLFILVLFLVSVLLAIQLGFYFADTIRILSFSILLAYIFINVVDYLDKLLRNRGVAILIVYVVMAVIMIVGCLLIVPAVIYQISQLIDNAFNQLPQLEQFVVNALRPLENRLHAAQIQVSVMDILGNILANIPKPDPAQIVSRMTDVAMSTMTWMFYALSIIVVSFYFLLDGRRLKDSIIGVFPQRHQDSLRLLAADMDRALQAFFRGQIVLGLLFGAFMISVYAALGVHYALLLGVFLGIWEVVPVIGPTIGFAPTLAAVALDGMDMVPLNRLWQIVIVTVVFNVLQWVKDNFIAPRYIGNVIGLHPVMIFIAIMIGAKVDGIAGVICSLPVACVLNVLLNHYAFSGGALRPRRSESSVQVPEGNSGNAAVAALNSELELNGES